METISTICSFLVMAALVATPILFVVFLIRWVRKKPKRKVGIATLATAVSIVIFTLIGTFTSPMTYCEHQFQEVSNRPATCEEKGEVVNHCNLCDLTRTERPNALGHDLVIVSRREPTIGVDGEVVEQCSRCEHEVVTVLEKLPEPTPEPTEPEATPEATVEPTVPPVVTPEPTVTEPSQEIEVQTVTFADIYYAYKRNELAADDLYKHNRYQITAKVVGIESDGLFNLTGGAMLTMEIRVDNIIVYFYAEFEKEQEEDLKTIVVGDTITFEGTCLSAGSWVDCDLLI